MLFSAGNIRPSKLTCGRRALFTTGPGPDAGGSKPGKVWMRPYAGKIRDRRGALLAAADRSERRCHRLPEGRPRSSGQCHPQKETSPLRAHDCLPFHGRRAYPRICNYNPKAQGNRVKNSSGEEGYEEVVVPGGDFAFEA
jgi:hypothetical protein